MAWTPTRQALDVTLVADKLLGFIEDNNADALRLVSPDRRLKAFDVLYPNAPGRLLTKFPWLVIFRQGLKTKLDDDLLFGELSLTIEGAVKGPKLDALVLDTKKYARAVELLMSNIPSATLMAGAAVESYSDFHDVDTEFDTAGSQQIANSFLTIFRTTGIYHIRAAAAY